MSKETTVPTVSAPMQITIGEALTQIITKPIIVVVKTLNLIENELDNIDEEQQLRLEHTRAKRNKRIKDAKDANESE